MSTFPQSYFDRCPICLAYSWQKHAPHCPTARRPLALPDGVTSETLPDGIERWTKGADVDYVVRDSLGHVVYYGPVLERAKEWVMKLGPKT